MVWNTWRKGLQVVARSTENSNTEVFIGRSREAMPRDTGPGTIAEGSSAIPQQRFCTRGSPARDKFFFLTAKTLETLYIGEVGMEAVELFNILHHMQTT